MACGRNGDGQCNIPTLDGQLRYTQDAAGDTQNSSSGVQRIILALDGQLRYMQVAAGGVGWSDGHTVLLRSDGSAVACGRNGGGQSNIPGQRFYTD